MMSALLGLKLINMSQKNNFNMPKFGKRRLIRGAMYIALAAAAWFAQQQGWLNNDKASNNTEVSQEVTRNTSVQNKSEVVELSQANKTTANDNALIAKLYQQRRSDEIVTAVGKVGKILADDNKGSRHQKFLLDIGQKRWLLVAHNIDLAQRVPYKQGDPIIVHGEYEWNEKGGVLHWTHHDPRGYHEDGYIEHNGKRYK
jgi:hypothetical protein